MSESNNPSSKDHAGHAQSHDRLGSNESKPAKGGCLWIGLLIAGIFFGALGIFSGTWTDNTKDGPNFTAGTSASIGPWIFVTLALVLIISAVIIRSSSINRTVIVASSALEKSNQSTTRNLEELKELREKGLITDAEYEHKRTAIIERM